MRLRLASSPYGIAVSSMSVSEYPEGVSSDLRTLSGEFNSV